MSSAKNGQNKDFESSQKEDVFLDQKLRPDNFDTYVGQEHIKKNLKILLDVIITNLHIELILIQVLLVHFHKCGH